MHGHTKIKHFSKLVSTNQSLFLTHYYSCPQVQTTEDNIKVDLK